MDAQKRKPENESNIERPSTALVFPNHIEMSYIENVGFTQSMKPTKILVVENFIKEERRSLDRVAVKEIQNHNDFWRTKYPASELIRYFQFRKGSNRTQRELDAVFEAESKADGHNIYEKSKKQSSEDFEMQLTEFLKKEKSPRLVLEIESKQLFSKVTIALTKGIREFIIVGGDYDNFKRWRMLTNQIHITGGRVYVVLMRRYSSETKETYIRQMAEAGVDYIFHGSIRGFNDEDNKPELLFLDGKDGIYKPLVESNAEIARQLKSHGKSLHYPLSRSMALDSANAFVKTRKVKPIIEE